MKIKFIAAIHNLELEKTNSKIDLTSGYISNDRRVLDDLFDNSLSLCTIGLHSIDDIKDAPSFYIVDRDLGDDVTQDDVDIFGTSLCFALLRQIQILVGQIWNLRDNSIYVRDGFLFTYIDDISNGYTFKASVSAINTFSNGEIRSIIIPDADLLSIGKDMTIITIEDVVEQKQNFRSATQIQHYKKSGLSRKELAEIYVNKARMEPIIPVKILMYCSAMEALVANSTTELSHRVAERIAILLGDNKEQRCEIYSTVKNGYDTRSKVAHGDLIKKDEEIIKQYSVSLDEYLRQLLRRDHPYNLKSNEKLDEYFLSALMK